MGKQPGNVFLPPISVERASGVPLYKQIYGEIRRIILDGSLRRGLRLPSTRLLAEELGVSRNIVVLAFEQLVAEGYLESRTGAGTSVAKTMPDEILHVGRRSAPARLSPQRSPLSKRGRRIASMTTLARTFAPAARLAPFQYGLPALEELPLEVWGRLVARHFRRAPKELLGHGDSAGYWPLREAIASYAGVARGVRCHPSQVIVVNGSQQAIDLAARVLLDPGDRAAVENPGYLGARSALQAAGIQLVPVAVDAEGLSVDALKRKPAHAKLVYVTPSHQFPLGVVLSLARRLELLAWAARRHVWIFEDDYDSEYRYESRPIPALQGFDQEGRVIYVGTLSKVLFPSIRFGYLIVPEDLVQPFVAARALTDISSPLVEQAALADFIAEGHLASHIRRMRALYMERRDAMKDAIQKDSGGLLEVQDTQAGMHFVAWLPAGGDDAAISREAAKAGLYVMPVSAFALTKLPRAGLLLGFAGFRRPVIRKGIRELSEIVKRCCNGRQIAASSSRILPVSS
jgi:GntR family transcriptional regulator/MocR family aminotransferase